MDIKLTTIPAKEYMPGYHGRMIHGENMTLAFWEVTKGAVVPEHAHMNEQIMQVLEGEFELTVNGRVNTYKVGDLVLIPPNCMHGGKALTDCKLMDAFSPVREAYR